MFLQIVPHTDNLYDKNFSCISLFKELSYAYLEKCLKHCKCWQFLQILSSQCGQKYVKFHTNRWVSIIQTLMYRLLIILSQFIDRVVNVTLKYLALKNSLAKIKIRIIKRGMGPAVASKHIIPKQLTACNVFWS